MAGVSASKPKTAPDGMPRYIPAGSADSASEPAERSPKRKRSPKHGPSTSTDLRDNVVNSPAASLTDDSELIEDLCRFSENILSEKEVRKRHRLTEKDWVALAEDDDFVRKVDDRRTRRIHDGSCKRELAQKHVVRGPEILSSIMSDPATHAKHKIDSIKALDQLATPPGQAAGADSSRFVIQIDLTADGSNVVEHYNKPRAVGIEDDPGNIDTATLAIIAAKQNRNDGGGQNHI
jgi:hypothetical protein